MQASVFTFAQDGSGSALLDDGQRVAWSPDVFARSGLRHVRPGQRVSIEFSPTEPTVVTRVWIAGIGPGETIR